METKTSFDALVRSYFSAQTKLVFDKFKSLITKLNLIYNVHKVPHQHNFIILILRSLHFQGIAFAHSLVHYFNLERLAFHTSSSNAMGALPRICRSHPIYRPSRFTVCQVLRCTRLSGVCGNVPVRYINSRPSETSDYKVQNASWRHKFDIKPMPPMLFTQSRQRKGSKSVSDAPMLRPQGEIIISTSEHECTRLEQHTMVLTLFIAGIISIVWVGWTTGNLYAEAQHTQGEHKAGGGQRPRNFRMDEICQHGAGSKNPWVVKGNGVYDITEWVDSHPGGKVILRAAGSTVEPYWDIFTIHNKQDVHDILEQFRIGNVDPCDLVDGHVPHDAIEDPFKHDPKRDPRLIVLSDRPCNAETPTSELSTFITDNDVFYIRNHLWVPSADECSYHISVDLGDGSGDKIYSLSDLKTKFQQYKITAALQCSGNRRKHLSQGSWEASGLQWDIGAIGNAEWRGPKLRDVLIDAGLNADDPNESLQHALFSGEDAYGASIPLLKALDPYGDVLLAHEMNSKPIPRDHGCPLRLIVPGHVGARSVKWVNHISLSSEESPSQWQRRDYKGFGPNETPESAKWEEAAAIQEVPVQSAITAVEQDTQNDYIAFEGYAISGGGRRIIRVDVSVDDGKTWDQAQLMQEKALGNRAWSWRKWHYDCSRRKTGCYVIVKAVDEAYNVQPESHSATYNFRGNLTSAWHRIRIGKKDEDDKVSSIAG